MAGQGNSLDETGEGAAVISEEKVFEAREFTYVAA